MTLGFASHKPLSVLVRVVHVAGPGLSVEAVQSPGYYADMRISARREMSWYFGVMSLIMWNFRPDTSNEMMKTHLYWINYHFSALTLRRESHVSRPVINGFGWHVIRHLHASRVCAVIWSGQVTGYSISFTH